MRVDEGLPISLGDNSYHTFRFYVVVRFLAKEPPERSRLFFIALLLIDILPTSPQLELVPFSRREGEEKIS